VTSLTRPPLPPAAGEPGAVTPGKVTTIVVGVGKLTVAVGWAPEEPPRSKTILV
jgi:hypothetical protein